MDSTRKTLYREDSLGGDQNRVRPRSYSFYDLIEDQDQGDQLSKHRRTREQQVRTPTAPACSVSSTRHPGRSRPFRVAKGADFAVLPVPSFSSRPAARQDLRHKAIKQGFEFVRGVQREEALAFKGFVAGVSDAASTSASELDRNDSLETQPSLDSVFVQDVNQSFKFQAGTVSRDVDSPRFGTAEADAGNRRPSRADSEPGDAEAGSGSPTPEVISLEERAQPIAEEEGDISPFVDAVLVVNSTGYVAVHFDVRSSGSAGSVPGQSGGPGGPLPGLPVQDTRRNQRKRRKKKKKPAEPLEERDPWTMGPKEAPSGTGRTTPTKAHKVFDQGEKKMSYSKKREALLAHLRAVNLKQKERQPKSPEPQTRNQWAKATRMASVGAAMNDSYLAALDSAKRANQLSAKKLTPPKKKTVAKVSDPKSDYRKRYGRVRPKTPSPVKAGAEVVSLKLTELISTPVNAVRAVSRLRAASSAASSPKSPRESPKPPGSAKEKAVEASPPPVEMSFKLSEITSPLATKFKAVSKFKSFRSLPRAQDGGAKTTEAGEPVKLEREGIMDAEGVREASRGTEGSSSELYERMRALSGGEEATTMAVAEEEAVVEDQAVEAAVVAEDPEPEVEEIVEAGDHGAEGPPVEVEERQQPDNPPPPPVQEEEKPRDRAPLTKKAISAVDVDPKIVDYFMQSQEDEEGGKSSKRKKSKLKKLFGKMLCRKM